MKQEILSIIGQIRFLMVLIETGELCEYEIQFRTNCICADLERIADLLPEVDA
ncbi:hypothetical protein LY56_01822 [Roseinatronobacter thiooxidans]|uniref:Uncharacterized protein n=1 Tax=Roseinatronobacter thiooxidans TaxID=121821 RepID=A0A2W7Q7M8_9RHOB|nr:hypothetical protein LY56_01822 [Roseinatronobacter thiooxidans]